MKRFAYLAFAFAVAACGPTMKSDDGDDQPPTEEDADGDGISNSDEGQPAATDTDGDGTPDFEDDDSDGDGIPDYREAGDGDAASPPIDSDGDGTPDFRDLDSDGNGREDTVDGVEDSDADNVGDWADVDDDGDLIADRDELGPNPAQPVDTDGDGLGDYRDTDSDGDSILDAHETAFDFDMDGAGNYRDTDSDADCVPDQLEARGMPPVDSDGDGRMDFVDRDSDNDGVGDSVEDANCNGATDGSESNPLNPDTDGDGVTDLVETAAGTDPSDPNSNPQANGDYVFVEPYMEPQSPTEDDLDFKTNLQAVDLYVMLDRTQTMQQEVQSVKTNLRTVVRNLTCAPVGTGQPPNCIPDLWAGAATIGYAGSTDGFNHYADIQPSPDLTNLPTTEPGGCCNEPLTFAALTAVANANGSPYGLNEPPRASCAGSPAANAGYQTFGYPCFRQGALPVVLMATDEAPISSGQTQYNNPSWANIVKPQYLTTKARFVGVYGNTSITTPRTDMELMARDTGAVDALNNNAPLVFPGADANASTAIEQGIIKLANGLPLDLNAVTTDDPADAVDAVTAFVDHIETLQLGTPQCANGLSESDSADPDSFNDLYNDVRTGTPVCWKVVSKPNTTVPPTENPQLFKATITVYGDGITQLDQRDVYFLVPPKPLDGPIE